MADDIEVPVDEKIEPEQKKIVVHDKVLAHLSKGLYRSPASALRELVSNAWDANASTVRIDTNYPNFLQVTIEDDGDGFDREAFDAHMTGNIGNSVKRAEGDINRLGRPLIGRLGIGLLGIAQICGGFTIASRTSDGKEFQARVALEDDLKTRIDRTEQSGGDTGERDSESEDDETKNINIGYFVYEEPTIPIKGKGTIVIADDVHTTFARTFQESIEGEDFVPPPLLWSKCIATMQKVATLQQLGDYWRLLFELAASCPVPYETDNSVPDGLIVEDQKRLNGYGFRVFVDGRNIKKPIDLKGNKHGYTTMSVNFDRMVYGKRVMMHGYIVAQEGAQLRPDEIRGVLIRIKNIGIGYYDQTLLDYRINEGPRTRWITGELYVDRGLEDSLNIDRDSFNRFDPEFRAVQEYVHGLLQSVLFKQVYKNIDKRSKDRMVQREQDRSEALTNALSDFQPTLSPPSTLYEAMSQARAKGHSPDSAAVAPVVRPEKLATKKSNQQLAAAVLTIFDTAMEQEGGGAQRAAFERLLLKLLRSW